MKKLKIALLFALLNFFSFSYSSASFSDSTKELVMAVDMIRHGDRTPVIWLPNILKNLWKKEELGLLTKKGEDESRDLGVSLKNYYIEELKFLPHIADKNLIYVRSTDYQRTKATAKSVLDGMFGNSSSNITINVKEKKEDPAFALEYKHNEKYKRIKEIRKTKSPQSFTEQVQKQIKYVNDLYNNNDKQQVAEYELMLLGDALNVGKIHNKPLPENMTTQEAAKIMDLSEKIFIYIFSIPAKQCYKSKYYLAEIIELFNARINHKTRLKYTMLTLHDANILPMLLFLGYTPLQKPEYNAIISFELLKSKSHDNDYFVRILYNRKPIKICTDEFCSLQTFQKLISENINKKCNDFDLDYQYLEKIGIS